jgi:uncharacterized membrane protein
MHGSGTSQEDLADPAERAFWLGTGFGLLMSTFGMRSWLRWPAYLVGGGLLVQAVRGRHVRLRAAGTRERARVHQHGIKVSEMVTINRSPEELYAVWRDFENLPKLMRHVESVQILDSRRSRWKVRGPAGLTVEWDAEIVRDIPNELITWQSLENAEVIHAGSVSFERTPGSAGTEVRVILRYDPPGGALGATLAGLLGEEPSGQIREDLRNFKRMVEFGEFPTVKAKP